jgi:heme/copper-type cytochrome/quinol oxidase subunit 3
MLETVGSFVLAGSMLLLIWNVWTTLRHGEVVGVNPWGAKTLEWTGGDAIGEAVPTGAPTLGMLALISSEVVFFGSLVATYAAYRTHSLSGPGPGTLEVGRTALFSLALFASSATIVLAERRLHHGDRAGFGRWLVVTIALGAIFLAGQATEYARLHADGIQLGTNLFTSAFFTLTGFHGVHVVVGLIALVVVALLRPPRGAVGPVALYWHFVDGVWVVVFSTVYLWNLL